jgi:hypothetical protein
MEDSLFSPTITNKVHKEAAIQIGTFLGGPLVAGYLIAHNFRQLDQPEKVKKTWLWTIIGFVAIVALAIILPQSIPAVVFAAVYTGATHLLVKRFQSAQIKAHIEAGSPLYKTRRAALIGLGCAGLFIILILVCYSLTDIYLLMR